MTVIMIAAGVISAVILIVGTAALYIEVAYFDLTERMAQKLLHRVLW